MRVGIVVLAVLVATITAGGRAAAQPIPEHRDPPMMTLGPVELRPRVLLTNIGVDTNVFNEFENPKRDFTTTAVPDLELAINPGRARLTLLSGVELVYFREYDSERSVNPSITGRADVDLNVLRPFVSFTAAQTTARSGNEIDVRAKHYPRSLAGGARIRLASRTALTLTARRSSDDYDGGEIFRGVELARTLNGSTTGYEASIGVELTPLTTASVVFGVEQTRFDQALARDADSVRIVPTITFSPLGLLTGTASVGYERFEGRRAALPTYTGLTASGSLGVVLADRFRIEGTFTRDVRYSYEETLPYYVQTAGRGTITTLIAGGLDVRVTGGRESLDYRAFAGAASPGRDRVTLYGGGFGYRFNDRLQFVLTAEFIERVSARETTRGYDNDRVFATLNWGATTR
jgi:hypothetical protein